MVIPPGSNCPRWPVKPKPPQSRRKNSAAACRRAFARRLEFRPALQNRPGVYLAAAAGRACRLGSFPRDSCPKVRLCMAQKKPDTHFRQGPPLNDQIAALESEIKKLDTQLSRAPSPKFRSTAMPQGETMTRASEKSAPPPPAKSEPVFEEIKRGPLMPRRTTNLRKSSTNSACASTICPRCGAVSAIIFAGRPPAIRAS